MTRSQLEAYLATKILSGGSDTTAQNVRDFLDEIIDSCVNLTEDKNVAGGYIGADLTAGKILVGNGSNVAVAVTPSGGLTIDSAGVVTLNESFKPIFNTFFDAGNVNTNETDLYNRDLIANQFATNGDKVTAQFGGSFQNSPTATRQLRLYFATNLIFDSTAITTTTNLDWVLNVTMIRADTAVIRYMTALTVQGIQSYTSVGELSGVSLNVTQHFELTGQAGGAGAATNDIVLKLSQVNYIKAA